MIKGKLLITGLYWSVSRTRPAAKSLLSASSYYSIEGFVFHEEEPACMERGYQEESIDTHLCMN